MKIRVSLELIARLLWLPENAHIVDVEALGDSECAIDVRGEDIPADGWGTALVQTWDTDEGPRCRAKVQRHESPRSSVLIDFSRGMRSMIMLRALRWAHEVRLLARHEVRLDQEGVTVDAAMLGFFAAEWGSTADEFEVRWSGDACVLAEATADTLRRLRPHADVDCVEVEEGKVLA